MSDAEGLKTVTSCGGCPMLGRSAYVDGLYECQHPDLDKSELGDLNIDEFELEQDPPARCELRRGRLLIQFRGPDA